MKKSIYQKTITSIFISPTLGIDRQLLYENNFINAYLGDKNNELYSDTENIICLLFIPCDENQFREFINIEYERTEQLIDDYYYDNYAVLVYSLDKKYLSDIEIIKQSKYSLVSTEFKKLFPETLTDYSSNRKEKLPSIQHMIFNKDKKLAEYWNKELKTSIITDLNLEVWIGFNKEKEILDIKEVINQLEIKNGNNK